MTVGALVFCTLLITRARAMQLFVRDPISGTSITAVEAGVDATIRDVKDDLMFVTRHESNLYANPNAYELQFGGTALQDDKKLSDLGVGAENELCAVWRSSLIVKQALRNHLQRRLRSADRVGSKAERFGDSS